MESYILHIDTASANGLVMLGKSGMPIALRMNTRATEHASFVQPAIAGLMDELGITQKDITCIAVANGPGSYTGLRVGLAAAKGLCFAWNKPLITISSLKIMAAAIQQSFGLFEKHGTQKILIAPLIDARRMEVFRALYRHPDLATLVEPGAEIITPGFVGAYLENHTVVFSGDGAEKWKNICESPNAIFIDQPNVNNALAKLAYQMAEEKEWADLAYSEPYYSKAFHNTAKPH